MGDDMTPPMDDPNMMGGDPTMDSGMSDDGQMPTDQEMPTDFDSNFDPGVEADEETDPKRFIQQLTGKLSQSLNSYNNENGEVDQDLNKYVASMVVTQAAKGLDDKDRKEIIKKINTSDAEDTDEEMTDDVPVEDDMNENPMPQNESKVFNFTKQQIFESLGIGAETETANNGKEKTDRTIPKNATRGNRGIPFTAPRNIKK